MQKTDGMAEKLGEDLGGGEVLFRQMQKIKEKKY